MIAWARDTMQNKICGIIFKKTDKGAPGRHEATMENIGMLVANHFAPSNVNIHMLNTCFQEDISFFGVKVRTFQKIVERPTCIFDMGFFANYRIYPQMLL